ELTLRGAHCVFTLPESIDKDLYFICTGTGIAPFRSMAQHRIYNKIPHQNIYLIFGCRKLCDGLYASEMKELEQKSPSFKYIPTLSREDESAAVRRGYVHAVYEELCRDKMVA